jgi:hypothetical protein
MRAGFFFLRFQLSVVDYFFAGIKRRSDQPLAGEK